METKLTDADDRPFIRRGEARQVRFMWKFHVRPYLTWAELGLKMASFGVSRELLERAIVLGIVSKTAQGYILVKK